MGTTQLHLRNPFVIAWWSLAYPGLGHLLLSKYIRGFLLFTWEVFLNYNAHINLAILYSFTGRFQMAKDVLDTTWVMFYAPTYLFAVWDSYRTTVDLNLQYISVFSSFMAEPFFVWVGIYNPKHWKCIYSFPIIIGIYLASDWFSKRSQFEKLQK